MFGLMSLISGPIIFARCDAQKLVFLRRLSHDRRGINGIPPARDLSNMEDRKLRRLPNSGRSDRRTDLPFAARLQEQRLRERTRHLPGTIMSIVFARTIGTPLPRRKPAKPISSTSSGSGRIEAIIRMGSAPMTTATSRSLSFLLGFPIVTAAALHALPVHAGCVLAENLKPIQPQISAAGSGCSGEHHAESNEAAGIARPAFQNRQLDRSGASTISWQGADRTVEGCVNKARLIKLRDSQKPRSEGGLTL